jgi:hypothetical protein
MDYDNKRSKLQRKMKDYNVFLMIILVSLLAQ